MHTGSKGLWCAGRPDAGGPGARSGRHPAAAPQRLPGGETGAEGGGAGEGQGARVPEDKPTRNRGVKGSCYIAVEVCCNAGRQLMSGEGGCGRGVRCVCAMQGLCIPHLHKRSPLQLRPARPLRQYPWMATPAPPTVSFLPYLPCLPPPSSTQLHPTHCRPSCRAGAASACCCFCHMRPPLLLLLLLLLLTLPPPPPPLP